MTVVENVQREAKFCHILCFYNVNLKSNMGTEAEFLDVIGRKVLRVFLLAIHSHLSPIDFTHSSLE
jgi:hypothetical protein